MTQEAYKAKRKPKGDRSSLAGADACRDPSAGVRSAGVRHDPEAEVCHDLVAERQADLRLQEGRQAIDRIDQQMARLFDERLEAVAEIAAYKRDHGLPTYDPVREGEVLAEAAQRLEDPTRAALYLRFQQEVMALAREFQEASRAERKEKEDAD